MRRCMLPSLAGLCLLLAVVPVRAEEPAPIVPAVTIRVKSIEHLVGDARYLAGLADKTDDFKQYEGIYKSMLKGNSLEGIDVTRPIGGYSDIGPNGIDSRFVLLIPVADEKAILDFIAGKDIKPEKDKDGSYKIDVPNIPTPVHFRFAHKYMYLTLENKDNIAPAILLEPSKILPAKFPGTMSVMLDIGKIPEKLKKEAIAQMANQLELQKEEKMPDETEAQHKFRAVSLDEFKDWTKLILNDGSDLSLIFDIDREKGDLSLVLSLAGKKGTTLATKFADLGSARSVGAGLIGKDSAANFLMHVLVSERMRKAMEPVIDEGLAKGIGEEKDKGKREAAEKVLKVLAPTLKSGEVDLGINLRGPSSSGKYAAVGALKVKDGAAIEKTLKELIPTLPEKDRKNITLDIAKSGGINIHKIEGGELDQNAKDVFGEGPAFFAVREDALMFSIGDGALEALKEALTSKPAASKALQIEVSVNRIIKLIPKEQQKLAEDAAKKAFARDKEADKIALVLEAGHELKLRLNMKAALVTFFDILAEGKKID